MEAPCQVTLPVQPPGLGTVVVVVVVGGGGAGMEKVSVEVAGGVGEPAGGVTVTVRVTGGP